MWPSPARMKNDEPHKERYRINSNILVPRSPSSSHRLARRCCCRTSARSRAVASLHSVRLFPCRCPAPRRGGCASASAAGSAKDRAGSSGSASPRATAPLHAATHRQIREGEGRRRQIRPAPCHRIAARRAPASTQMKSGISAATVDDRRRRSRRLGRKQMRGVAELILAGETPAHGRQRNWSVRACGIRAGHRLEKTKPYNAHAPVRSAWEHGTAASPRQTTGSPSLRVGGMEHHYYDIVRRSLEKVSIICLY
uniref:Uncharacterized protein n=1 Tax=Leersia perrieri TaxID=77586 RepID=A0A0D9XSF5_9ORYZ